MGKILDISGHIYQGIKVISFNRLQGGKSYWNLICHCGNSFEGRSNNLRTGHLKSCGCIKIPLTIARFRKHGESHSTKEYRAWCSIRKRCFNKNEPLYYTYGGRGITVCDRWLNSYDAFLSDVGRAPSINHSIDRINVNGNYEPGNVRWATTQEQSVNKTKTVYIIHDGIQIPLKTFCDKYSLNVSRIRYWYNHGLSSNEIINRWNNVSGRLYSNSSFTKVQIAVIRDALSNGHSLTKIGKYFKTTKGTIWKIKSGYSWQSV